jgi:mitochondrial fission protein ELM1
VTDGAAGHESQAIAVAESVGLPFSVRRVRVKGAMRFLPPALQIHLPARTLLGAVDSSAPLEPPWPRLIISSGGRGVPVALAVKRLSDAPTFALHIHDPRAARARFDLIAAPAHDRLAGDNVIATCGSLHGLTRGRLAEAGKRFGPQVEHLPHPRIAVLLGGDSKSFSFPPEEGAALGEKLAAIARETGGSLLVTASRRTRPETLAALANAISGIPQFVWDGTGDNPYVGFLAMADAIVVSEDSVNMASEAAGTGKPVYVQALPGKSRRLARFHAAMRERGATRPFEGRLETWSSTPVNDTATVASAVRRALGLESTS